MGDRVMPCAVCGQKIGTYICKNCGRLVCEECYNPKTGMCAACL